uniref:Uncharacterized protein n=1 Tax=Arundo donax TaxID=35708 RepID=A0A0A9E4X4_ARUDO
MVWLVCIVFQKLYQCNVLAALIDVKVNNMQTFLTFARFKYSIISSHETQTEAWTDFKEDLHC